MSTNAPPTERGKVAAVREWALLGLACFAPWALGAVDGWAELVLAAGAVAVTLLGLFDRPATPLRRRLTCVPSLALAGLAALALVQAAPLPGGVLGRVAPAAAGLRARLVPAAPERVAGDDRPARLPAATIGREPSASVDAAARLAVAWTLFQAVLALPGGVGAYRRFARVTVANGTVMALFALVQSMTWNGKVYWVFPSPIRYPWATGGPFIGHSHLAEYLNMALGMAVGYLLAPPSSVARSRDRAHRLWAVYAVAAMAVSVLASNSRGGVIAMAVSGLVTGVLGRFALRGRIRTEPGLRRARGARGGLWLAVTFVMVGLFLWSLGEASPYLDRMGTLLDPSRSGLSNRTDIWEAAVRAWRSQPFWGTGLGGFAYAAAPYIRSTDPGFAVYAESEFFHMLAEGGLVGLGLELAGLAAAADLARRAFLAAPRGADQVLILGGVGGGLALAVQCVGDFGLHVPGVAVTALALAGHLTRLGLEAQPEAEAAAPARGGRAWGVAAGLFMAGVGCFAAVRALELTRAEAYLEAADVPLAGTLSPSPERTAVPGDVLRETRGALEAALRLRPDWAEGHLRLGIVHLRLYEQTVADWVRETAPETDPLDVDRLADPLHLLAVAHAGGPGRPEGVDAFLGQEPVRDHLVPAARSFLEARRCCPVLALAHAELATLDYLMDPGDPGPAYGRRALGLASDMPTLTFVARAGLRLGDTRLAAASWRKALEIFVPNWAEIADEAGESLPPAQILDEVLPPGARYPVLFAERLYAGPGAEDTRAQFLRAAVARLGDDPRVGPAERLWLESQARADLGERERARALMESALQAEPLRADWRAELVRRLLEWGRPEDAHRQALIGQQISPSDPSLRRLLQLSVEALAKGRRDPAKK